VHIVYLAQGKVMGRGSEVKLTGEELQGLRQEMEQQEVILQGYQQENVAAMQKIKVRAVMEWCAL